MKLTFTYGNAVAVLPAALTEYIERASKRDLQVLLELACEPTATTDLSAAMQAVCDRLHLSRSEWENSLAFWRGTGILCVEEGEAQPAATATAVPVQENALPRVIADKGLPSYSTEELSDILARRAELSALIDDCQRAFGKIFNTGEVGIIAGLADYLGLDAEYILLLLTHCRNMEKKSLRYVEKMAITLHDEGVHDARDLEERLHRIEVMAKASGRIRTMFGITSRALTAKEKSMLEAWLCGMQYDDEVIRRAYEATVDAIGKASISYANKILERWHADGLHTAEEVDAAMAEYRRQKAADGSSFDVDDFFGAALERTYGKKK